MSSREALRRRLGPWPAAPTIGHMPTLRAVIIDWGGVLTQPIADAVRDWIAADKIDWDSYLAAVGPWLSAAYNPAYSTAYRDIRDQAENYDAHVNPVHVLERGECTVAWFERLLAERLVRTDGGQVLADGLLTRMLAASRPDPVMYQLIRDLRGKGVRTALLSNSWGPSGYERQDFPHLFDAVVISAEVGMRKPEPRIFYHAAELLDTSPDECVFVDDLETNVKAAAGLGMTGVLHKDPASTAQRLTELFADR
jgi:epoxide hydrolase-like predicted phosphatase